MSNEEKPAPSPAPENPAEPGKDAPAPAPVEPKKDESAPEKKEDAPKADGNVVPEVYEFEIPDGSLIHESRLEEIAAIAKQKKLSNADAQKLVDSEHAAVMGHINLQKTQIQKQSEAWLSEAKQDKEIGGEKFEESVKIANDAMKYVFSDNKDLKEFLNSTGLGNNPVVLKGFWKVGKMLQNDKILSSNTSQPSQPERPPIEKRLYDHPTSQ